MRIGRNPFKGTAGEGKAYTGKQVTVAMLTYIPNFVGYYRERFELLKLSLVSLIEHTPAHLADVLVFDNGSCEEVRNYFQELHEKGAITFYVQSKHNLGYNGALNMIYSMNQSPFLSYADDDVFFHPGWLEKALEIHNNFPSIGMVSCCPCKMKFLEHHEFSKSLSLLYPDSVKEVQAPERWNKEWDEIFLHSIGDQSVHPEFDQMNVPVLVSNGVECFPVSTHFHYVLSTEAIEQLYPFPTGDLMSSNANNPAFNMRLIFDKKLDDQQLAKVCTVDMYTEHLGNVWSERADYLKTQYNFYAAKRSFIHEGIKITWQKRLAFKFMNLPWIGKLPNRMYEWLFDLINAKTNYDRYR